MTYYLHILPLMKGLAIMDEIYGWTDLLPAVNSEFDVVREAAEEFGLYDD